MRLAQPLAAHDGTAIFLGREAFPVGFGGPLFHGRSELNYPRLSLSSETRAADNEASDLGTLSDRFSLLRHASIVAYSGAAIEPFRFAEKPALPRPACCLPLPGPSGMIAAIDRGRSQCGPLTGRLP